MSKNAPAKKLLTTVTTHKGSINTVVYSNKGSKYILSGGQDRKIQLSKSTAPFGPLATYEGHGYEVLGISCAPDNVKFASCGGDKTVFLWDTSQKTIIKKYSGHMGKVNSVCFNEDASILASGSYDTTVRLWDIKSQQRMPLQILEEATDSITSIVISKELIITGSVDGYVRTYDLRRGELRTDYFEHPIASLTLSIDASFLLVSTLDSKIRSFDIKNGRMLQTYTGHRNVSYRSKACFDGNKETIVTFGDEEGRVWEWSFETGTLINSFKAHEKTILWTAHHPTESQVVTASSDGTVKIWGL